MCIFGRAVAAHGSAMNQSFATGSCRASTILSSCTKTIFEASTCKAVFDGLRPGMSYVFPFNHGHLRRERLLPTLGLLTVLERDLRVFGLQGVFAPYLKVDCQAAWRG
jgi:hypothetical protein